MTSQSRFDIHASHTFAQPGLYAVEVTVKDCSTGGVDRGQASAQVADAPLTAKGLTLSATAGVPFSGSVAEFADGDPGAVPAEHAATIDWGDGRSGPGTVVAVPGAGFRVDGSTTYGAAGSYVLEVTIADTGGAAAVATTSMTVAAPAPPPAHGFVAAGTGARHAPSVRVYDAITGQLRSSFLAYPAGFRGGVRVAAADGALIAGPGPGAAQPVKVFDAASRHRLIRIWPFGRDYRGGVFVAAGDVDGDGHADVIVGAGAGGAPHVKVFSGATGSLLRSFLAFSPGFRGGVRVAAGDVDGDGRADIVAGAGPGGAAHVKAFSGATGAVLRSFLAYGPSFSGGVYVAAGDVDGDGRADIVSGPGAGAPPNVKAFSGATGATLLSAFAFAPSYTGGVRVASADADGDGRADVVTSGGSQIKTLGGAGAPVLSSFLASGAAFVAADRP